METVKAAEKQEKELSQLQAIQKDEYWAKKYDVTADDLKGTDAFSRIASKIIKASGKNKSFAV